MREPLPEARNPTAPGGAGPRATPPMPRARGGAPYGPSDSRVVDVPVPERFAETVRGFVRWLDGGPNNSTLSTSRRGQAITMRLEVVGAPEYVLRQAGA